MTISLYHTDSDNRNITKNLQLLKTLEGYVRNENEIGKSSTTITIEIDNISTINSCNYLWIDELKRFYYVGDTISIVNGLWTVECHVDPLMSFKNDILKCEGILLRSTSAADYYIQDPKDILYQNPYIVRKNFPSSFDGGASSTIIITI